MFPTPIGGTVVSSELAASLVFAALYGLLVPVMIARAWDRQSRTFLLFGTYWAVIDRIVLFSLRAVASQREGLRISNYLLKYGQVSFGLGFVAIGNDLVNLLRCVLVNATFGYGDSGRFNESPAYKTEGGELALPVEGDLDRPEERAKLRRFTLWLSLAWLASSIPGMVSLGWYHRKNLADEEPGDKLFKMRYASTAVGLLLVLVTM